MIACNTQRNLLIIQKILIVILIISIFCTCSLNENENVPEKLTSVEFGVLCAWCGADDILLITKNNLMFSESIDCADTRTDTTISTKEELWTEMLDLLELNKFLAIDFHDGGLSHDGCNIWVTIENDTVTHSIGFEYIEQAEIQPIRPFLNKLIEFRDIFTD